LSKLKPMVGNNRQWEAFSDYLDDTIKQYHKTLEQSDDPVSLHRSQGAVAALKKLQQLRDEVQNYG